MDSARLPFLPIGPDDIIQGHVLIAKPGLPCFHRHVDGILGEVVQAGQIVMVFFPFLVRFLPGPLPTSPHPAAGHGPRR